MILAKIGLFFCYFPVLMLLKNPLVKLSHAVRLTHTAQFLKSYYYVIVFSIVGFISLGTFKHSIIAVENTEFFRKSVRIFTIVCLYLLCLCVVRYIDKVVKEKITKPHENIMKARTLRTYYTFMFKFIYVFCTFLAMAAILVNFDKVKEAGLSLFASAGVLTGVLLFATKNFFSSIFTGLSLVLSQTIKLGDVVEINGYTGTIDKITLSKVTIKLSNRNTLILPSTDFLNKSFINKTLHSLEMVDIVQVYLDYNTSISGMRHFIKKQLSAFKEWDKRKFDLEVINLKSDCIEIRIQISAKNPTELWHLKCKLREKLVIWIQENHLESVPKVRVKNLSRTIHQEHEQS